MQLAFLDVGQGDAALVTTPEGRRVLIDAGPDRDDVAALLRARGIDTVDLAVASHNHADHIGGMAAAVRGVVVRNYLDNGVPTTTATYARTLDAVEARGTRYLRASERTITVGSVTFRVLPVPAGMDADDQNNQSVGVVVEHGGFRALFTGDAEEAERGFWRRSGRLPAAAVLKVSHHGSPNGTDARWLDAVRPSLAVISVGTGNTYGHPGPGVLKLLAARRVRTLRTDRDGEVVVTGRPDGSFTVRTLRASTPRASRAAASRAGDDARPRGRATRRPRPLPKEVPR